MEIWLVLAVLLLLGGVVGSVLPVVPGAALSVAGVLLYWWSTGYADPSAVFVGGVVVVGVAVVLVDWFSGAIAAKVGGADTATTAAAAAVGAALLFVAGPLGLLAGIAVTVFVVEVARGGTGREGVRAAGYAVAGVFASVVVQLVVTVGILLGFVVAVLV